MALDPNLSAAFSFARRVERFYAALIPAGSGLNEDPALGGQLLYAGELDEEGRAWVVADSIAGAASLIVSTGEAAQKQAIRDGVVDFLVTTLDEALRILKNEIRKRQPVAVCVAAPPEAVEREMLERGVAPDLLRPGASGAAAQVRFLSQGARQIDPASADGSQTLLAWSVAAAPAQSLPKLDALALECLGPEDRAARRWLRLAPRYLGRLGQGVRILSCAPEAAKKFMERVQLAVDRDEIGVQVFISYGNGYETITAQPKPPAAPNGATQG